jgi:hypothetical protein
MRRLRFRPLSGRIEPFALGLSLQSPMPTGIQSFTTRRRQAPRRGSPRQEADIVSIPPWEKRHYPTPKCGSQAFSTSPLRGTPSPYPGAFLLGGETPRAPWAETHVMRTCVAFSERRRSTMTGWHNAPGRALSRREPPTTRGGAGRGCIVDVEAMGALVDR